MFTFPKYAVKVENAFVKNEGFGHCRLKQEFQHLLCKSCKAVLWVLKRVLLFLCCCFSVLAAAFLTLHPSSLVFNLEPDQ